MPDFSATPGYWFVAATVLPLVSFVLLLLAGGLHWLARRYRSAGMESLYEITGGDRPGKTPAYVALGAIALACVCSVIGFVQFQAAHAHAHHAIEDIERDIKNLRNEKAAAATD